MSSPAGRLGEGKDRPLDNRSVTYYVRYVLTTPAADTAPTFKVDNILYSSWGYDQTNISFYRVVAVTKASVKITKLTTIVLTPGEKGASDLVVAGARDPKDLGPVKTKRIKSYEGKLYVSISDYESAYLWDGEPKHQTSSFAGH